MKNQYFKTATFWARELRIPLFLLSNIIGPDSLALYKKEVVHLYHLNNKEKKAGMTGFKFFTNQRNIKRYKKLTDKIFKEITETVGIYDKIDLKKLTDSELKKRFLQVMKALLDYSHVYLKTEEIYLAQIELESEKYKSLIKELGLVRFELRKAGEPLFYVLLGLFLKELARRFKLKSRDLFFYEYKEVLALSRHKKIKSEVLTARGKGYALIKLRDKEHLLTGWEFKKLFKDVVGYQLVTDCLVGKTAMKGRVRGKVRVILHNKRNITKDIAKFQRGEILVTEMTRPDTIMACKKAAAIITDEGGILCHAAIISRELKIPCIVGTKIATQTLKTGDVVKLDADKGTVKKLSV